MAKKDATPKPPFEIETLVFNHDLPIKTVVAGIDPSATSTAVAILTPDALIIKRYAPTKLTGMVRLKWLRDMVTNAVSSSDAQLAVIEGYAFGAKNSQAHLLGEVGGVIRLALWLMGAPLAEATPGNWKKILFAKGNMGKPDCMMQLFKRYGFEITQNDMCDAACLALVAAIATGQIEPQTAIGAKSVQHVTFYEPAPHPRVRHRDRPEALGPGEELREKVQRVAT